MDNKRTSLLIVEDREATRKMIRISLPASDYEIDDACSGVEALAMIRLMRPEVVLLEVRLPGRFNGFRVCREIRKLAGKLDIFVILISELSSPEIFEKAERVGANAYFVKPFRLAGIAQMIKRRHLLKDSFTRVASLDVVEDRHFYPSIEHALTHEMTMCSQVSRISEQLDIGI
jgi:CheY-like chemotaxis protein